MVDATQRVIRPPVFQLYVSCNGISYVEPIQVAPRLEEPMQLASRVQEPLKAKQPVQTPYQKHIEARNQAFFPIASLDDTDIKRVITGDDYHRRLEIVTAYVTCLKDGTLPIRDAVLNQRKKESTLDALNQLLKSKNITPLAFFPKSKAAMMRQIYKASKTLEEEINLNRISATIGKEPELVAKYIVNYGRSDVEYSAIFQIDKEFAEVFSILENEALSYLIDLEATEGIHKAMNWEPDSKDIQILAQRDFALGLKDVQSYIAALKSTIGKETEPSLNEIKFDKFLRKFNLSDSDLAVVYCYWKVQKDTSNESPVKVSHINLCLPLEGFSSEDESTIRASIEKLNKVSSGSPFKLRAGNGTRTIEKIIVTEAAPKAHIVQIKCPFLDELNLVYQGGLPSKGLVQTAYFKEGNSTKQRLHDDFHKYNSDSKIMVEITLSTGRKIQIDLERSECDIILADISKGGKSTFIPNELQKSRVF